MAGRDDVRVPRHDRAHHPRLQASRTTAGTHRRRVRDARRRVLQLPRRVGCDGDRGPQAHRAGYPRRRGVFQTTYLVDLATGLLGFAVVVVLAPLVGPGLVGGNGADS